jgi:hypothetical protein
MEEDFVVAVLRIETKWLLAIYYILKKNKLEETATNYRLTVKSFWKNSYRNDIYKWIKEGERFNGFLRIAYPSIEKQTID